MKYFLCRDGSTVEGPYSVDWLVTIPLSATAMLCPEGSAVWGQAAAVMDTRLPPALPRPTASDPLEPYIQQMSRYGYKVGSRSARAAQLIKPKQFNVTVAIICVLLALIPFLIYLCVYAAEKDVIVYLAVEPDGRIMVTNAHRRFYLTAEEADLFFR